MGKRRKPAQPPASEPGAPSLEEAGTPETQPVSESVPQASEPDSAPLRTYRVHHLFLGFRTWDLQAGDEVDATEEEAAPYLGGVLSLRI